MNLILGREGIGKGTFAAWVIARLTRGDLPGDLYGEPVAVGVLGDEDGFDAVWAPRLHAADADLKLVKLLERPDGGYVELRGDSERLARAVDLEQIRVLYFDALVDHLGVGVDDWRTKPVRDALQPLRSIAREFEIAAIGSMHPNKRGSTFRELVSGSVAFNAVSRSSLLLAAHPDDENRRVLVRGKGNLSRTPKAVEFAIASHQFMANGFTFDAPKAVNFAPSNLTVEDLIRQPASPPPAGKARTNARELIAARLADGEWHHAGPIIEECADLGIYERAVRRAARDLGVKHERSGYPGRSRWRLSQAGHPPIIASAVRADRSVRGADSAPIGTPDSEDRPDSDNARPNRHTSCFQRLQTGTQTIDADTELARLAEKGLAE